jgi:hypothetical protein
MMLLAKAFIMLLSLWEHGGLKEQDFPTGLLSERIPIVLMDILIRTLDSQSCDGSWGSVNEVTAYALITLFCLSRLPWFDPIRGNISIQIERAREFLGQHRDSWNYAEYLWIEKVAYSSSNLAKAYCLAAMKATERKTINDILGEKVNSLLQASPKATKAMIHFFSRVPMFVDLPPWKLHITVLQASQFVPALERRRLSTFSRKYVGKDRYLQYIPFTWTACGNGSVDLSLDVQWDMMVLSMLIYQVDEFMEAFVAHELARNLDDVRQSVRRHCLYGVEKACKKRSAADKVHEDAPPTKMRNGAASETNASKGTKDPTNGHASSHTDDDTNGQSNSQSTCRTNAHTKDTSSAALDEADKVLGTFISRLLTHPKVLASPPWLQHWLRLEIQSFLLAHLTHISDCQSLSQQVPIASRPVFSSAQSTYFDWVRTTAADTTGGPFAFAYFLCLIEQKWKTEVQKPLVRFTMQDVSRHLATLCRMENDAGSLDRDLRERNLNSVNFAEFDVGDGGDGGDGGDDILAGCMGGKWEEKGKDELLEVARYERGRLKDVMGELEKLVGPGLSASVKVFIEVTQLYGELYLVRDVSANNLNR